MDAFSAEVANRQRLDLEDGAGFPAVEANYCDHTIPQERENEIKRISSRVKNSVKNNDIEFEVAGPAEWNVGKGQYLLKSILQFKSMQGWTLDSKTGMLVNRAKPDSESIERVEEAKRIIKRNHGFPIVEGSVSVSRIFSR